MEDTTIMLFSINILLFIQILIQVAQSMPKKGNKPLNPSFPYNTRIVIKKGFYAQYKGKILEYKTDITGIIYSIKLENALNKEPISENESNIKRYKKWGLF